MKKRIIALLCVLALAVTLLPVGVVAADEDFALGLRATPDKHTMQTLQPGDKVTVEVLFPKQEIELYSIQAKLYFDNTYFECTEVNYDGLGAAYHAAIPSYNIPAEAGWGAGATSDKDNANTNGYLTPAYAEYKDANNQDANGKFGSTEEEKVAYYAVFEVKANVKGTPTAFEVKEIEMKKADGTEHKVAAPTAISAVIVEEISSVKLTGDITPEKNGTPVTSLTDADSKVEATVAWNPEVAEDGKFAANTAYTATITVTPETGYVWGEGATVYYDGLTFTKSGNTYTATKTFEKTANKDVPSVSDPTVTGTATYGDKLSVLTLSKAESDTVAGTWAWKTPDALVGNAGKQMHTAVFTPTDTANYTTEEKQVEIDVEAKSLSGATIAEIEPQTYNSKEIKPEPAVTLGTTTLVQGTDFTYSYENNTNAGTATVTITGKGNFTGEKSINFTIQKATVELTLSLGGKTEIYYGKSVGTQIQPGGTTAKVYYRSANDTNGKTEYTDDTKLGLGTYYLWAELDASENYNGSKSTEMQLEVKPMPLSKDSVFEITNPNVGYDGTEKKPNLSIKDRNFNISLTEGRDYEISFAEGADRVNANVNTGGVSYTITGKGNYTGTLEKKLMISPKSITVTVALANPDEEIIYDGTAKEPAVKVTYNNNGTIVTLEKDKDYVVIYAGNTNAGEAYINVYPAAGGNYDFYGDEGSGSAVIGTFEIQKADYTGNPNVLPLYAISSEAAAEGTTTQGVQYDLRAVIPEATGVEAVTDCENYTGVTYENEYGTLIFTGIPVKPENKTGDTVTVQVVMGNYKNYTLTIPIQYVSKYNISSELSMENVTFTYGDDATTPVLKKNGETVTGNYTITYKNDSYEESATMPTDAGTYTITASYSSDTQVTVSGVTYPGSMGTATATLTIRKKELSVTVSHPAITYGDPVPLNGDQKGNYYETSFSGGVAGDSIDLTVDTTYTQGNNAGEYAFTARLNGDSSKNYTVGTVSGALKVNPKTLTEAMVANITGSFTYNGEEQKPDVTVTDGTTLVKGTDYTVSYSNNVNAGTDTAKVKITGKGNYTGTVEKTFTISPKSLAQAGVGITSTTYDGTPQEPTPTVTLDGKTLVKGTDYTVSYSNNVNAGMDTAEAKITGKGNYTGEKEKNFSINKRGICIQAENRSSRVGEAQKELTWKVVDGTLVEGHTITEGSITLALDETFDSSAEKTYSITVDISSIVIQDATGNNVTANYIVGRLAGTYTVSNKLVPTVRADDIDVTYSGADVPVTAANPTATYDGSAVAGTWTWKGETPKDAIDTTYTLVFKPTDSVNYASGEVTIHVTIRKANPSGTPGFTALDTDGKTLADAKLNVGTISPAGTIAWELPDSTKVESDKAYTWIFTPTDTENYNTLTGTIVVYSAEPEVPEERTILTSATKHGELIIKPRAAKPGTEVTIYAEPDDGYTLEELYVLDSRGNEVKLSRRGGKYTFIMPERDVTVYASFKAEQQVNPFDDVSRKDYFYDAVLWAVENEVTSGTGASTFSPDDACTRAQTVTFMWRAAGSPSVRGVENPFTDVKRSDYFYEAVLWAVQEGITTGTSATTFSPDATVTRGQVATFLYRLADTGKRTYTHPFTDVVAGGYNDNAIGWAYAHEITTGTTKTTFGPDEACSRAQIVTFLYRYYGLAF